MDKINKAKLRSEIIWAATRQGSFQRSKIYSKKAKSDDRKKKAFRKFIREFLFSSLFLKFENKTITETQLISVIERLMSQAVLHHKSVLVGGNFRFGNAQKFVNLYLKSMWLAGWTKTPPHFPIDSIIQSNFRASNQKARWTKMNKKEYIKIITEAKDFAKNNGYNNVAEWEALTYMNNYIEKV